MDHITACLVKTGIAGTSTKIIHSFVQPMDYVLLLIIVHAPMNIMVINVVTFPVSHHVIMELVSHPIHVIAM